MGKLVWDKIGERFYEAGVDHAVLYPLNATGVCDGGVAWSGIAGIIESPFDAEPNNVYTDNIKYLVLAGAKDSGLAIKIYIYPDEWEECDGSRETIPGVIAGQQIRKIFGLSYRAKLGSDMGSQNHGCKLHLVYDGLASPSGRDYQSVNDSPESINPSWKVTTTPVDIPGFKSTACLIIVSTKADLARLKTLEDIPYDTEGTEPRLPPSGEVTKLLAGDVTVTVASESSSATLLGRKISELQNNVAVGESAIIGNLKNVTGHIRFSNGPSKQKGYYLALKFDVTLANAATTVELVGDTRGPVVLDEDENVVLLIENNFQSVKVISTRDSSSVAKIYILAGLALES